MDFTTLPLNVREVLTGINEISEADFTQIEYCFEESPSLYGLTKYNGPSIYSLGVKDWGFCWVIGNTFIDDIDLIKQYAKNKPWKR